MNPLKKAWLIYFTFLLTLMCVNSYDYDWEAKIKYDSNVPNDNKTCGVAWDVSLFSEPFASCWLLCMPKCVLMDKTAQWRCKKSFHDIFGNCHCCSGEL